MKKIFIFLFLLLSLNINVISAYENIEVEEEIYINDNVYTKDINIVSGDMLYYKVKITNIKDFDLYNLDIITNIMNIDSNNNILSDEIKKITLDKLKQGSSYEYEIYYKINNNNIANTRIDVKTNIEIYSSNINDFSLNTYYKTKDLEDYTLYDPNNNIYIDSKTDVELKIEVTNKSNKRACDLLLSTTLSTTADFKIKNVEIPCLDVNETYFLKTSTKILQDTEYSNINQNVVLSTRENTESTDNLISTIVSVNDIAYEMPIVKNIKNNSINYNYIIYSCLILTGFIIIFINLIDKFKIFQK